MLARFYGWSPDEISSLNVYDFNEFTSAMYEIQAREYLDDLNHQDFSSMKDEARKKLWNRYKNIAYPVSGKSKKDAMSNEDLSKWIRGALGG